MEQLLAVLLQARNVAHVHHWRTASFAQHLALGELYELLTDSTDELAEMYIGAHGEIGEVSPDEPTGWDKTSVLGFIQQLHSMLQTQLKSMLPEDDWLINRYEEMQADVARIKYKLEQLK